MPQNCIPVFLENILKAGIFMTLSGILVKEYFPILNFLIML
jgi:hypothetical protein